MDPAEPVPVASLFDAHVSVDEFVRGLCDAYEEAIADAAFRAHMMSVFPADVVAAAVDRAVCRAALESDRAWNVYSLQLLGIVPPQPVLQVLLCAALWQHSCGGQCPTQRPVRLVLVLPTINDPTAILRAMQPYHVGELTVQCDVYRSVAGVPPESLVALRGYPHLRTLVLEALISTDPRGVSAIFGAALKSARASHVKITVAFGFAQDRTRLGDGVTDSFAGLAWPETLEELDLIVMGADSERCMYEALGRSVAAARRIRSLRMRLDGSNMSARERHAAMLPPILQGMDRLETLRLSNMKLDAADVYAIGKCSRLRSLVLDSISVYGWAEIAGGAPEWAEEQRRQGVAVDLRAPSLRSEPFIPALKRTAVALHSLGTSLPALEGLSVSFTNGSAVPYVGLLNGLIRSTTLRSLTLMNVPLLHTEPVDDAYLELLGALGECCEGSVRDLHLWPASCPHSTDALIAFIGRHCGKLRRLRLPSLRQLSDEQHAELLQSLAACRQLDFVHVPFLSGVSRSACWASQQTINDAKLAAAITLLGSSADWLGVLSPLEATCSIVPGDLMIPHGQDWFSHYDDLFVRSRKALSELARKRAIRATARAWAVVAQGILRSQELRVTMPASSPHSRAVGISTPERFSPQVLRCIGSFLPELVELRIL